MNYRNLGGILLYFGRNRVTNDTIEFVDIRKVYNDAKSDRALKELVNDFLSPSPR